MILRPVARALFIGFEQLDGADPAIDGENIAFRGNTDQTTGIYAYINGQLVVIANTTTPRPDGGNFGFNADGGSSPAISGSNVVFSASPCGVYACIVEPPPPIPAVSAWGLIVLSLATLTSGAVILRRRDIARAIA